MLSPALTPLPVAELAEGPAQEFFLSYPYLLIWTDQSDVWRFEGGTEKLVHVSTLAEYVERPRTSDIVIDEQNGIVVIPEWSPISRGKVGPPSLWVFHMHTGEVKLQCEMFDQLADKSLLYRNGHALALLVPPSMPRGSTTSLDTTVIARCNVAGDGELLSLVKLPTDLSEREQKRDLPSLVLEPVFFAANGDIIATSTTRWLGKIDVLRFRGPRAFDYRVPDARLEIKPQREDTTSMIPVRCVNIDDVGFVVCATESSSEASASDLTSVVYIESDTLAVRWTAERLAGNAERVQHLPALGLVVVMGKEHIPNDSENDDYLQYNYFVAILDVRTGARLALDGIDSGERQRAHVNTCEISADPTDPDLVVVWDSGEVNVTNLKQFIESGFERESENGRVCSVKVFPPELVTASVGRRHVIAIADAKMEHCRSESSFDRVNADEAHVFIARW